MIEHIPALDEVQQLAAEARARGETVVPIYREVRADLETPVSAYLKLARGPYSFLLESAEGGERMGRYSFIGTEPFRVLTRAAADGDPLRAVEEELQRWRAVRVPGLPRFHGGAVGYIGYEAISHFEPRVQPPERDVLGVPESWLMFADTLVVFDHLMHTMKVVAHVRLEGDVEAAYRQDGDVVEAVRFRNVPAFLHSTDVEIDCPGVGALRFDIAYGGNFYAIADPQPNFADLAELSPGEIVRLSPIVRRLLNAVVAPVHPEDPTIRGISHVMWTGRPTKPEADGRNAVFYGDKAIDRSPCGTGTSARMAQLAARGGLAIGDAYVHESIIGSLFTGRVEETARVGNHAAIVPSIEGWARITGLNTILIDDRDPYAHGFQVV